MPRQYRGGSICHQRSSRHMPYTIRVPVRARGRYRHNMPVLLPAFERHQSRTAIAQREFQFPPAVHSLMFLRQEEKWRRITRLARRRPSSRRRTLADPRRLHRSGHWWFLRYFRSLSVTPIRLFQAFYAPNQHSGCQRRRASHFVTPVLPVFLFLLHASDRARGAPFHAPLFYGI